MLTGDKSHIEVEEKVFEALFKSAEFPTIRKRRCTLPSFCNIPAKPDVQVLKLELERVLVGPTCKPLHEQVRTWWPGEVEELPQGPS